MQPLYRTILAWCILAHTPIFLAQPVPYIAFRSQAVNAARHMVGWNREINRPSEDELSFSFNVTTEYTQSFNGGNIARCLFGDDIVCDSCKSIINVTGYDISNPYRGPKDWFAPYFGLPLDFQSCFEINPSSENFILDFGLYVGLDNWYDGLYLRFQGPFVHNRRRLHFNEIIENFGIEPYPQGWYGADRMPNDPFNGESSITRNQLNTDFTAYITGHAPQLPDGPAWQPMPCNSLIINSHGRHYHAQSFIMNATAGQ